jgi:hypothetical protein
MLMYVEAFAYSYHREMFLIWLTCIWLKKFLVGNNVWIFAHGARSMVAKTRGFIAHVTAIAPECISSYCVVPRWVLALKKIKKNALKTVSEEGVKIVNFVKSRSLSSRVFSALCEEIYSSYTALLLHTEIRGRVLVCVFRNVLWCWPSLPAFITPVWYCDSQNYHGTWTNLVLFM